MTSQWLFQLSSVVWVIAAAIAVSSDRHGPITKPGCKETCANSKVQIPFPFGIGNNCYHSPWYEIICNSSFSSSSSIVADKPILRKFNVEVFQITTCTNGTDYSCSPFELTLKVATNWQTICTSDIIIGTQPTVSSSSSSSIDLGGSPFRVSTDENVFVAALEEGYCSGHAIFMERSDEMVGGCSSTCQESNSSMSNNSSCDGVGCCSIPVPYALSNKYRGIGFYKIGLSNESAHTCMKVAVMENFIDGDEKKIIERLSSSTPFPILWQWEAPTLFPDLMSQHITRNHSCTPAFSCDLDQCSNECSIYPRTNINCEINCYNDGCISVCTCRTGYEGNPYIPYGCQDVYEVPEDPCLMGKAQYHFLYCGSHGSKRIIMGLSIGLGSVIVLLCSYFLYIILRRQLRMKRRAKFFKTNGGLLLQQQMTSIKGVVQRTKVFTVEELEKATDSFNKNRILGQGGQGTVFKGMLTDGNVVAIKKSKKVDQSQTEQFINEVVILSQINHRNVVKLLGCCLETEVPLLVYEFIPNGALYQHIQNPSEDFHITWKIRLQIAAESAGAIAYLHSASAMPIYHRDIKSSNILLDEKYRAKVADFGTSRTIMIDQTHVTTCVQGTFGYLDPEYFQSNQFTEKSDVYSFGVVLVELLTSKKPVTAIEYGEWRSLTIEFLFHMENHRLFDLLDPRVIEEAKEEEIMAIASLAKRCLNLNGKRRPTMKAVAMALEGIISPNPSTMVNKTLRKDNDVVMEIRKIPNDYASPITFMSEKDNNHSYSVEVQPLMYNTV